VVPIERKTVAEATADALRSRILSGELKAGAQLRQEMLAAELGVSRIPLREAFRRLEGEGLVTIVPHHGTVVSVLSADAIDELFDLRSMIEPDLLKRAIPNLTPAHLAHAERILAGYQRALLQRDVQDWGRLNSQFHMALYEPAGRPRSLALAQTLLDQTDRYTRMQLLLTGGQSKAQREHAEILRACAAGEADRASKLLARHIRYAGLSLAAFMRSQATAANGAVTVAS